MYLKKFLITGITGTMGTQLATTLLNKFPNCLVFGISRDEQKQREMFKHSRLFLKIADVRNKDSIIRALGATDIDCTYHLAALKCVDTVEENVFSAVETNVIGTQTIVDLCDDFGSDLILASTDKACYPINAYGHSKALAEKIVTSAGYKVCRYGNVLGSRGSFLPAIISHLKAGTPVPITDVNMTRFWMRTEEVAHMLLDALEFDRGSKIIVPTGIKSCRVVDLIYAVADILKIENFTLKQVGIRPGEKIHETLETAEEGKLLTSDCKKVGVDEIKKYLKGLI